MPEKEKKFIQAILKAKLISPENIQKCLDIQKKHNVSITDVLLKYRLLPPHDIQQIWQAVQNPIKKKQTGTLKSPIQRTSTKAFQKQGTFLGQGRYELLEEIGRGGMGVVYKATDLHLKRIVAIKVVLPQKINSKEIEKIKRFSREILVTACLEHPHIVRLLDAGQDNNLTYLAMSYIIGKPLSHYIKHNASLETKMLWIKQIAEGLYHAHQKGIVHRDVKPSNIIIADEDNSALIMDFGLAKNLKVEDLSITKTGVVMGTPRYMAPEQLLPNANLSDPKIDIYALGAVMYELLTGVTMVSGKGHMEVFYNVCYHTPTPLRQRQPDIPEDIEKIWQKATARDLSRRYQNMQEFAGDIGRFFQCEKIQAPVKFWGIKYLYAALVVIVALAVVFWATAKTVPEEVKINQSELSIELARLHYEQQEFDKCEKLLQDIFLEKISPEIFQKALYYKGLIYYQRQDYSAGAKTLKQALSIIADETPTQIRFFLGKCLFLQKDFTQAITILQQAEQQLQQNKHKELLELHYLLGKSFFEQKQYHQAKEYLEKCLQQDNYRSEYHCLYAETLKNIGDYAHSYEAFQKALDLAVNDDAFEGLCKLFIQDFSSNYMHPLLIHYYLERSQDISIPFLFCQEFYEMADAYRINYEKWLSAQNPLGSPKEFVQRLTQKSSQESLTSILQVLSIFRYHPDFDAIFQEQLSKAPISIQKNIRTVWEQINQQKDKEQKQALYYRMIRCWIYHDVKEQQLLEQEFISQKTPIKDTLVDILDNEKSAMKKFLAAQTLIYFLQIDILEQRLDNNKDSTIAGICTVVLLRNNIPISQNLLITLATTENNEFLKYLVASEIYIHVADQKIPEDIWQALFHLCQDENPRVQIAAAASLFHRNGIFLPEIVKTTALNILIRFTKDPDENLRSYAHLHLWNFYSDKDISLSMREKLFKNELLQQTIERGLKDKSFLVRRTVLHFTYRIVHSRHVPFLLELLQDENSQIQFLAIFSICEYDSTLPVLKKFLLNGKTPFLHRMFTLFFTSMTFKTRRDISYNKVAKKLLNTQENLLKLTNDSDPNIRGMAFFLCSFLGRVPDNYERYIEIETDDRIRAYIIANLATKSVFKWQGSGDFARDIRDKLKWEKYLNHPVVYVKKATYMIEAMLSTEEDKLYALASSQSAEIKEGVAIGLHKKIINSLWLDIDIFQRKRYLEDTYQQYIREMRTKIIKSPTMRKNYKTWLNYAINLCPKHYYYNERAVIYECEQNWLAALSDLQKAIDLSPQNETYKVFMANILLKTSRINEIGQILNSEFIYQIRSPRNLLLAGQVLIATGGLDAAQMCFLRVCTKEHYDGEPFLFLAYIAVIRNDVEKAIHYIDYHRRSEHFTQEDLREHKVLRPIFDHPWILENIPRK